MTSDLLPLFFPNTPIGRRLLQIAKDQRRLTPTTMPGMLKTSTPNGTMFRPLAQAKPSPASQPAGQLIYQASVYQIGLGTIGTFAARLTTVPGAPIVQVSKNQFCSNNFTNWTLDGVAVTFIYSDENTRTASDGINSQIEVLRPPFQVGDPCIIAMTVPNSVLSSASWIDLTPRWWARRYIQ